MPDEGFKTRFWRWVMRFYPAVRHASAPFSPLTVPLPAARVALVTSCGVYVDGDRPFDLADRRGDPTFREIPGDVDMARLRIAHAHYDHRDALADINCVFPLERLRGLAAAGEIGAVAPRHFGFMGSIPSPGRLIRDTAPAVARRLAADGVHVALLVPC